LCERAAGGISKEITPNKAQRLLDTLTPTTPVECTRHQLAQDHVEDLWHLDTQLRASRRRVEEAVAASGTSLTDVFGIGPIVAAMIIGHTRDVARFATRDCFAAYCGTAPIAFESAVAASTASHCAATDS
jgi:transposase